MAVELSDTSKAQVAKFVAFFKAKKERLLADRQAEKDEFKMDRLADEGAIFNQGDVSDMLYTYHAQICGCLRESLDEFVNSSAVYVSQILLQGEQASVPLDPGDLSSIEEQHKVAEIAAMVAQGVAPPLVAKRNIGALPTLSGSAPDPAAAQKMLELEQENQQMLDRTQMMQAQISELLKERSGLTEQLAASGAAAAPSTSGAALNSGQFKELMAIVEKKTSEVKELRRLMAEAGLVVPAAGGGVELTAED